ncbi:NAD(P)-binding protein [Hypoxylon crocopeplum]|nr:NAD(P)-binding protein [Hypoxylon crocopeplum]
MAKFQVEGFAIVTGAASGVGKEVAFTFAEAGAKGVIFADINEPAVTQASEESKKLASNPLYRTIAVRTDVTDADSVQALVDLAVKEFGRIDYCINSAGVAVGEFVRFTDVTIEDFERVLGVNTKGAFLLSKAVVKAMQAQEPAHVDFGRHGIRNIGRGSIVHVSSALAFMAGPFKTPYTTSKHALMGITRAIAQDCKFDLIRVNQVCPTWVKTPMYEEECEGLPPTAGIIEGMMGVKRPVEPDEVAAACLYFCTPSAVYLSGSSLVMDSAALAG